MGHISPLNFPQVVGSQNNFINNQWICTKPCDCYVNKEDAWVTGMSHVVMDLLFVVYGFAYIASAFCIMTFKSLLDITLNAKWLDDSK